MLRFRSTQSLQKFVAIHANVYNHYDTQHHLIRRQTYKAAHAAALAEWQNLAA